MEATIQGRCDRQGLAELVELSNNVVNIIVSEGKENEMEQKSVDKNYILGRDNFSNVIFESFELKFDGFDLILETNNKKSAPQKMRLKFYEDIEDNIFEETINTINKIAFNNKATDITYKD